MTSPRDPRWLHDADLSCVWHPFTQQQEWAQSTPLVIERGEGVYLYDIHGKAYIDGVSSLWTNVHGHGHPHLDGAIRDQLAKVAHSTFLGLTHPTGIELAHRLVQCAPDGLSRVFYSDNGSTSTEVALKMAFQYQQQVGETQRIRFAGLKGGYHGDTMGAVSVGSIDLFHEMYRPMLFNALALPAPVHPGGEEEQAALDEALALLDAHGHELAAFIFEPLVQGAAGMKMHSKHFIHTLATRAREHGVLLIADEVAVGFGRMGTLFAMEQVGIQPDFLCLAKGLSAGYLPLAATLTTETVYNAFLGEADAYKQFFHGHTFTANPLACAVSIANLDLFEQTDLLGTVQARVAELTEQLATLRTHPAVRSIRQRGVMVGIDLQHRDGSDLSPGARTGHAVCMRARDLGAILRPLGDTVVLNPPLQISAAELEQLVKVTREAVDVIE